MKKDSSRGEIYMDKPMSPYEFLKSTRPDEFSDSTVVRKAKLNREFFDYYLNSITNRSQEKEFQLFCKRMAEYEICPNLLPQTGPTGGGDSKVDSETYPVSDDLALTWYSGIGRETASERWAFAISAKKDWRSKVKTDVENIISTNRCFMDLTKRNGKMRFRSRVNILKINMGMICQKYRMLKWII